MNEQEAWAIERAAVAARESKRLRKQEAREAVNELPTVSQRVIGRVLLWLN